MVSMMVFSRENPDAFQKWANYQTNNCFYISMYICIFN